jgi:hypothetical protein
LIFIAIFFLELFDTSGAVDELLFTRKERMAGRADLDTDLFFG